jgi:hypothetical protein
VPGFICLFRRDAPDFRIAVEPATGNGLRETSQIMVD